MAQATMLMAVTADNLVHAQYILDDPNSLRSPDCCSAGQNAWEDDGGR